MSEFAFNIDVPVRSEWSNVDLLITSVENCFAAMFADVDGCHTIAMVTGELLENAIKYGDWTHGQRLFRLHVAGKAAEDLFATLKWLEGYPSADEAYRARLLEVANGPRGGSVSKLGLVRIAYEANCKIRAERTSETISVTAELQL